MHQLYQSAQIITSNLLFAYIMQAMNNSLSIEDALLLTIQDDDLVVVEVIGHLPDNLVLSACRTQLEAWTEGQALSDIHPDLHPYQQVLQFQGDDGKPVGYLVFSGAAPAPTLELALLIDKVSHLMYVNHLYALLDSWQDTQSKLKYQLSFFINTVNNIFEPYDHLTMARLYMEIISEMFLFPTAVVYELCGDSYVPIASRGIREQDLNGLILEAEPILSHPTLSVFPQCFSNLNPEQLGAANYQTLQNKLANLIIPLQIKCQPQYLMICCSAEDKCSDNQDWRIISALSQTFNRAIELNEVRQQLMISNQDLDKKVFALTTVYQAAERILTIADLKQTAGMALDMLMEIFQSVTSTVFIHNETEGHLELLAFKSVMGSQDLSYWLALPAEAPLTNNLVVDYTDPEARRQFLQSFPRFEEMEKYLQPLIIVHLVQQDRYYGFVTLSTRMTEQPYTHDDLALLSMLSHSIAIALDNAWMMAKMQGQNRLLDQRLADLMAIQDTLRIMRQATSLTEFCTLMENTLKLGVGAQLHALLVDSGQGLINIYGSDEFTGQYGAQLPVLSDTAVITVATDRGSDKLLAVPIRHPGRLSAYLVISEFTDTVFDDAERVHLLDLVAAMLADTLAHLYELHCISQEGVFDYPRLVCLRLQQEFDQLAEFGLTPCIVKFRHQDPAAVIRSLDRAATGAVLAPQIGVLIGRLPADQLLPLLEPLTSHFVLLGELSPTALFTTAIP